MSSLMPNIQDLSQASPSHLHFSVIDRLLPYSDFFSASTHAERSITSFNASNEVNIAPTNPHFHLESSATPFDHGDFTDMLPPSHAVDNMVQEQIHPMRAEAGSSVDTNGNSLLTPFPLSPCSTATLDVVDGSRYPIYLRQSEKEFATELIYTDPANLCDPRLYDPNAPFDVHPGACASTFSSTNATTVQRYGFEHLSVPIAAHGPTSGWEGWNNMGKIAVVGGSSSMSSNPSPSLQRTTTAGDVSAGYLGPFQQPSYDVEAESQGYNSSFETSTAGNAYQGGHLGPPELDNYQWAPERYSLQPSTEHPMAYVSPDTYTSDQYETQTVGPRQESTRTGYVVHMFALLPVHTAHFLGMMSYSYENVSTENRSCEGEESTPLQAQVNPFPMNLPPDPYQDGIQQNSSMYPPGASKCHSGVNRPYP
ncbi:hypothetical protein K439DRAFT_590882 [Ramaria rubella]|nr:hypothetical protein K439DRAFT_590882 [Ramaria rubella]